MGLFICFKKDSKYKNVLHSEIENEFVTRYGYTQITQEECNRIIRLAMTAINEKGETFCKKIDEKGVSQGISTAMLAGHTEGDDTILIMTKGDEVESSNDIRAILVFNYEEDDDDDKKYELSINVLCSNQVTKSGGAKILLENLIDITREKGIKIISLNASETAINYYEKFGFRLEPRFKTFMSLKLGEGKGMIRLIINLKSKRKLKSRRKRKSRRKSKSKSKSRRKEQ